MRKMFLIFFVLLVSACDAPEKKNCESDQSSSSDAASLPADVTPANDAAVADASDVTPVDAPVEVTP